MNLNKRLTNKVLMVLLILSLPSILPLKAISQSAQQEKSSSQDSLTAQNQNNEGGGIFRPERREGGSRNWQEIETVFLNRKSPFERPKPAGGSRSGNAPLCLISPHKLVEKETIENAAETPIEIWSDRPLFIWQNGLNNQMVVVYSADGEKEIWSQEAASGKNTVMYDGDPLQPGESYQWNLSQSNGQFGSDPVEIKIPFKVMETNKREAIRQDLQQIDSRLAGESIDVIALEKANYFIDKNLWSDALQIMFSVDNPSEELEKTINEIQSHTFCSS